MSDLGHLRNCIMEHDAGAARNCQGVARLLLGHLRATPAVEQTAER
jgi:hypothetical protein